MVQCSMWLCTYECCTCVSWDLVILRKKWFVNDNFGCINAGYYNIKTNIFLLQQNKCEENFWKGMFSVQLFSVYAHDIFWVRLWILVVLIKIKLLCFGYSKPVLKIRDKKVNMYIVSLSLLLAFLFPIIHIIFKWQALWFAIVLSIAFEGS